MIKGLAHVCLSATDLAAVERFYCRGLGLKKVFVIITFCPGCPINGIAFGLLDGALVGVSVQKIKSPASLYLYLIAFWFVLVKF